MSQTTVLQYESPWPVYSLDWCNTPSPTEALRPRSSYRLALGSFTENYRNRIAIIGLTDERSLVDDDSDLYGPGSAFSLLADAVHGYPATKLQWQPASAANHSWSSKAPASELLATTGDALRVWEYVSDIDQKSSGYVTRHPSQGQPATGRLSQKIALSGKAKGANPTAAPLTSFAWNSIAPSLIVTASIDTTCTVWDIAASSAVTQLIAHDREVYDVAWLPGSVDIFTSVGADGSLRAFDLRSLDHSTILYETPAPKSSAGVAPRTMSAALSRIAFNPNDSNYMATFHMDSTDVQVLDMRSPGQPVVELSGHRGQVNAVGWGSQEASMIATVGDDCQLLVWDIAAAALSPRQPGSNRLSSPRPDTKRRVLTDPVLAYTAASEINNVAWSPPIPGMSMNNGAATSPGEWIAITTTTLVTALKV